MKIKKLSQEDLEVDIALDRLAEILVDAFIDKKISQNPSFVDPRINKPVYDLIKFSKEREKNRK